jgi:glycosyltransferase involved in cell wall biosynthesis
MRVPTDLKLVQVSASLDMQLGGPSYVVEKVRKILHQINIANDLLVLGKVLLELKDYNGIPSMFGNRYGLIAPIHNSHFKRAIKNSDILLIHGYYLYSTLLSIRYSKHQRIFLMPHGSLEMYQERRGKIRKFIFRRIVLFYLKGRKIHFLLGSEQEITSVEKVLPGARSSVVGLGIEESPLIKDILAFEHRKPIVLYCMSRIATKKRIDLCIQALSVLNKSEYLYRLDIYGSGNEPLESELRALVRKLNLGGSVNFIGFVEGNRKIEALRDSDIFLLPSENENFAVAVAESISVGNPVIVSEFVAMHSFVDEHTTGITIASLDVGEIVRAIEIVTSRYRVFQTNCLKSAHILYWENVIENWLKVIYQDLENSYEE